MHRKLGRILAEVLIEHWSKGRFHGYSAGSFPKGAVHALALEELERHHLPTTGLRSKSWNEFARSGAPVMDFVFTVCDQAGDEACPVWPGNPVTAHWGVADPAAVDGTGAEQQKAFRACLSCARKPHQDFCRLAGRQSRSAGNQAQGR